MISEKLKVRVALSISKENSRITGSTLSSIKKAAALALSLEISLTLFGLTLFMSVKMVLGNERKVFPFPVPSPVFCLMALASTSPMAIIIEALSSFLTVLATVSL